MAPLDIDTALEWRGRTVVDRDGDKIGKLEELYLDESDRPAWGAVATGLFGRRQSFVPLADLRPAGDDLQVPYEKDRVKDAPNVEPDEQLSDDEEDRLHRHYGIGDAPLGDEGARDERVGDERAGDERAGDERAADQRGGEEQARDDRPVETATAREDEGAAREERPEGRDSGEGGEMIRSEEEVDVSTRRRVSGKARLKKYVVTEHVQKVVPVQREEVRVELEPADGEAADGEPVAEGERPVEERPVEERPRE
jgi:stress response protein YsnF